LILVTARIEAHPAGRRELAQALLDWAVSVRREAGSTAAHVYEDLEAAASVFFLVSEWETRLALDAHVSSSTFGRMLGAVELLADDSEVTVTEAAGDWVPSTTLRRVRESRRQPGSDSVLLRFIDPIRKPDG
jgi:quinol monooxygenase YgiN